MAKKDRRDSVCWGLFDPANRWLVGGLFILLGLVALGLTLGYLPAHLAAYWPLIVIVAGLALIL